jgi:hypothetical protein
LEHAFALQHAQAVRGGFDHVGEHPAGFHFFDYFADDVLGIVAPFGGSDEGIFFLKLLDECLEPGVGSVEGKLPLALGAFDENFFPVDALIERDLRCCHGRVGGEDIRRQKDKD